jgi:hypothetical protein
MPFLALLPLVGCASISGQSVQPLSVATIYDNQEIAGMACTMTNDAGSWFVMSPGTATVHKSTGDLVIDCKKDALAGNATIVSKSNTAVWGNIIFGGGIGYIVDRNSGAGFDYPNTVTVMMRQFVRPPLVPSVAVASTSLTPVTVETEPQ